MDKFISLIKVDFNNTFGLSSMAHNFKKKKDRWQIFLWVFLALSLIPTYVIMVKALGNIYEAYDQMGQRSYFLQTGFFMAQILVFIMGILYVLSKYYFSNDLAQLVPLPIKSSQILGSKFIILMINEYLTSLPIILPFILIYGSRGGEGIIYWIYSLILILALPILPLVISSLLVMVFMKFTNIKGKKDLLRIIGSFVFLGIMIFIQLTMQRMTQNALGGGEEFYLNLVKDSNHLVKKLGIVFPPSMWASLSLASYKSIGGLAYLLLFLLISLLGYGLMIFLSENLFFDGLIGNIEVRASKGRSKKRGGSLDRSQKNKPYLALAKKELIMLFKTPVYLFNSIGGAIIIPLFIALSIFTGDESMAGSLALIKDNSQLIVFGAIGMVVIQGIMNSIGSTTFSREGKNFWIQRVLPIQARDQIIGRVLASLVPQVIAILALLISLSFIIRLKILDIIVIIFLGLLGSIPMAELGMIVDILRPLLIWDNPQKAMKQNLNVLIAMGAGVLYSGILIFLVVNLLGKIDPNYLYLILAGIFIISSLIFYLLLEKLIVRQFRDLE